LELVISIVLGCVILAKMKVCDINPPHFWLGDWPAARLDNDEGIPRVHLGSIKQMPNIPRRNADDVDCCSFENSGGYTNRNISHACCGPCALPFCWILDHWVLRCITPCRGFQPNVRLTVRPKGLPQGSRSNPFGLPNYSKADGSAKCLVLTLRS
jgi:hypothetical protein